MGQKVQVKSPLDIKIALLHRGWTVADLGRAVNRPRSTVSQAIHQNRFPKVRKQIISALWS